MKSTFLEVFVFFSYAFLPYETKMRHLLDENETLLRHLGIINIFTFVEQKAIT